MGFPSAIPSYLGFTSTHTLSQDQHASQHNSEQADIVALATKVGTGSAVAASNQVLRGNGAGTSTWDQVHGDTDIKNNLPATVLQNVYPVGCIYTETTGVNPATTFSFGTWTAFGAGRVLIGAGTSDQAFAAGASGGESSHTLVAAEMPSHVHNITDPGHTHTEPSGLLAKPQGTGASIAASIDPTVTGSSTTGITINSAGSDGSHNNLQPYIVIYFWKRTA